MISDMFNNINFSILKYIITNVIHKIKNSNDTISKLFCLVERFIEYLDGP